MRALHKEDNIKIEYREKYGKGCRKDFLNHAVILTKYDSTAKGGVAISIGKDLGIPVFYVCTGETYSDISLFNCDDYLNTFLGL